MPSPDELNEIKTLKALKERAKRIGVKGYSKYTKAEMAVLRKKIRSAQKKRLTPASAKSKGKGPASPKRSPSRSSSKKSSPKRDSPKGSKKGSKNLCFVDPCPKGEYCKLEFSGRQKRCTKTKPKDTEVFETADGKRIVGSKKAISQLKGILDDLASNAESPKRSPVRRSPSARSSVRSSPRMKLSGCAVPGGKRCDPGKFCSISDAGNGRCLSKRPKKPAEFKIDGRTFVGSAEAIAEVTRLFSGGSPPRAPSVRPSPPRISPPRISPPVHVSKGKSPFRDEGGPAPKPMTPSPPKAPSPYRLPDCADDGCPDGEFCTPSGCSGTMPADVITLPDGRKIYGSKSSLSEIKKMLGGNITRSQTSAQKALYGSGKARKATPESQRKIMDEFERCLREL